VARKKSSEKTTKTGETRVALVHDWLVTQRGGENVLLEIARLFPAADIYTLVHARGQVHPELEAHRIHTSFIQGLPGSPQAFRRYLPLFPAAVESFDLSSYDLVLSTSHCVAKGVKVPEGRRHIAYIHTPMRYLWDQLEEYLPQVPGRKLLAPLARLATTPLRRWDVKSAQRPSQLLANSQYVAARIERVWGRQARVLYPPVDTEFFGQAPEESREGYLVVSALVPYKRVDLAVVLATEDQLPLTVLGDGSELQRLKRIAGPTVRFAEATGPGSLRDAYAKAKALLFCGVEDFGIVPVEAMAAGCPVVALRQGGAVETVIGHGDEATGVFFDTPTVDALRVAVQHADQIIGRNGFRRSVLQKQARRFDRKVFIQAFRDVLH
jgi:glycosyltransferase involved in cell wall biosynthesis